MSKLSAILFAIIITIVLPCKDAFCITITASVIEHYKAEDKFVAKDNVTILTDKAKITANHAVFYRQTQTASLSGAVNYEDDLVVIQASTAEINLLTRLGTVTDAFVLIKDQSKQTDPMLKKEYKLQGSKLTRLAENRFYFDSLFVTTCEFDNATSADWCFKAKDADITIGSSLTAKDVTYEIKDTPVLYLPYLWAPVLTERQSGLLPPVVGNSNTKGLRYTQQYFLAIDDNQDATLALDYYSKAGLGLWGEYRYLYPTDSGKWEAYRIRDTLLNKQFVELRGKHRHSSGLLSGFADINYVNDRDFYREFPIRFKDMDDRFLQSSVEVSKHIPQARFYTLLQSFKDLKYTDKLAPQKIPELGFYYRPTDTKPVNVSLQGTLSNFIRQAEAHGQRLDLLASLKHQTGTAVTFTQALSLRETAYNLYNYAHATTHNGVADYTAKALSRFYRLYHSFSHVLEPSVGYEFTSNHRKMPLFDSIELKKKTSQLFVALENILFFTDTSVFVKVKQYYDFLSRPNNDPRYMPTVLESVVLSRQINARLDMTQNFAFRRTESINSEVSYKLSNQLQASLGQRYHREDNLLFYRGGIDVGVSRQWAFRTNFDYDERLKELRSLTASVKYRQKCWAVNLNIIRRPGYELRPSEYAFYFAIELKGIS